LIREILIHNKDLREAENLINEKRYYEATIFLENFILNNEENQEAHYFLGEALL